MGFMYAGAVETQPVGFKALESLSSKIKVLEFVVRRLL
jgi:hypothetical protein